MEQGKLLMGRATLSAVAVIYFISSATSAATYLVKMIAFVNSLTTSFTIMGNSIAVIMFVYGAAKYVYTADDPAARKQAVGMCIAAIMALIIIRVAGDVIDMVGVGAT
ncbi:MAG: hypothetical protein V1744_00525 [Candidatus Altiarchaeota archaeon]